GRGRCWRIYQDTGGDVKRYGPLPAITRVLVRGVGAGLESAGRAGRAGQPRARRFLWVGRVRDAGALAGRPITGDGAGGGNGSGYRGGDPYRRSHVTPARPVLCDRDTGGCRDPEDHDWEPVSRGIHLAGAVIGRICPGATLL